MSDFSFKINIDGVDKIITSVSEANKLIKELTEKIILAKESGQDFSVVLSKLNEAFKIRGNISALSSGISNLSTSLGHSQTASANAAQALLNLNYVIRDSPYFFQNFALGVLAVGNNLNPLIDSFSRLRVEAGEKNVSAIKLLTEALKGGAGLSIAFSVVVTAIQAFIFWLNRSKDETDKATKAIDYYKSAINKLIEVQSGIDNKYFSINYEQLEPLIKSLEQRIQQLKLQSDFLSTPQQKPQGYVEFDKEGKLKKISANKPPTMLTGEPPVTKQDVDELTTANKKLSEELENQLKALKAQKVIYEELQKLGFLPLDKDKPKIKSEKLPKIETGKFPSFTFLPEIEEIFNTLKKDAEEKGLYWSESDKAFYWQVALDIYNRTKPSERLKRQRRFIDEVVPQREIESPLNKINKEAEEILKERFQLNLEVAKLVANELGNALEDAFMRGKLKLDEFIKSLGIALAKMLLLKAAMGVVGSLFPGAGAVAAAGSGVASSIPAPSIRKSSLEINVNGKLTADNNKLVGAIETARLKYDRRVSIASVGRS